MFFSLKSAFLLGLVAISSASPVPTPAFSGSVSPAALFVNGTYTNNLYARAKMPDSITCDGKTFSKTDINNALKKAKEVSTPPKKGIQNGKGGSFYPGKFGNQGPSAGTHSLKTKANPGAKVFPQIPESSQLWEYPLHSGAVWEGKSEKGKVSVAMKDDYSFVGVMVHPPGVANQYVPC